MAHLTTWSRWQNSQGALGYLQQISWYSASMMADKISSKPSTAGGTTNQQQVAGTSTNKFTTPAQPDTTTKQEHICQTIHVSYFDVCAMYYEKHGALPFEVDESTVKVQNVSHDTKEKVDS